MRPLDLRGLRFGRIAVIEREGSRNGKSSWLCKCDCGTECIIVGKLLVSGTTRSCGCLRFDNEAQLRHGHSRRGKMSRTYRAWARMIQRCDNPNNKDFPGYGGRGICVCEQWYIFDNFLADMRECPNNLELDREDTDGNYEPRNCRWTDEATQATNRRWTLWVYVGDEKIPMKRAAERLGLNYAKLRKLTARNGQFRMSAQAAINQISGSIS